MEVFVEYYQKYIQHTFELDSLIFLITCIKNHGPEAIVQPLQSEGSTMSGRGGAAPLRAHVGQAGWQHPDGLARQTV